MLNDQVIIMANMRGGYADVGGKVHTLFRMTGRRKPSEPNNDSGTEFGLSFSERRLAAIEAYSHKRALRS